LITYSAAMLAALSVSNVFSYWYAKLFYNAAGANDFVGVSGHQLDGYHPIVLENGGWPNLMHRLTITPQSFKASIQYGKLALDDNRLIDGLNTFSGLFPTKSFAGRKFEIYQGVISVDVGDHALIATGVMGQQIEQDHAKGIIRLTLQDHTTDYDSVIPLARVTKALYPEAPEKNFGQPVPAAYGNFDQKTTDAHYKAFLTIGKLPAIITSAQNEDGQVECLPDTDQHARGIMTQLRDDSVFVRKSGYDLAIDDANVTLTANPSTAAQNLIKFTGVTFLLYRAATALSFAKTLSGVASATFNQTDLAAGQWLASVSNGILDFSNSTITIKTQDVPSLGSSQIDKLLVNLASFSPASIGGNTFTPYTWGSTGPQLQTGTLMELDLAGGLGAISTQLLFFDASMVTEITGIQDLFENERIVRHPVSLDNFDRSDFAPARRGWRANQKLLSPTVIVNTKALIQRMFFSGKGRKFSSALAGNATNYSADDLLENPAWIIAAIWLDEMEQTDIDYAAFNLAGDAFSGEIGDVFDDDPADIKFALSIDTLTSGLEKINEIATQAGLIVFLNSAGQLSCRTFKRTFVEGDIDTTVPFKYCKVLDVRYSDFRHVKNQASVSWGTDYANGDPLDETTTVNDTTSQGTTAGGYDQTLSYTLNMPDTLDKTTAENRGDAVLSHFAFLRRELTVALVHPIFDALEVTDVIDFSDFPGLILGRPVVETDDRWMVTRISKVPEGVGVDIRELSA